MYGSTRRPAGARKPRARPTKKALAPKTRKAVAQIARDAVKRIAETRYVQQVPAQYQSIYGSVLPAVNTGGSTAPPQLFDCLPDTLQGSEDFNREGNIIQPVKHTTDVRCVFSSVPIDSSGTTADKAGWDITVHCWYGYVKRYKGITDVIANATPILGNMFVNGLGTTTYFTGSSMDEFLELNKDYVSFKHKKVRMFKNGGAANVLDAVQPVQQMPTNEVARFHLNWKVPKAIHYGSDGATLPEDYAPVIVLGYNHNDYSVASSQTYTTGAPTIGNVPAIMFRKTDKLWFKDL